MVMGAQAIEQVEHGDVALGPVEAVVHLQSSKGGAALCGAGGVEPLEG